MNYMLLKAFFLKNYQIFTGGSFLTTVCRLRKRCADIIDGRNQMKTLQQVHCPHCEKEQMRSCRDMVVFSVKIHWWVEVQCIGCGGWISSSVLYKYGLQLIRYGAEYRQVTMPVEKLNCTGPITEGYVSDWEWEADDDPRLVAVLESEKCD